MVYDPYDYAESIKDDERDLDRGPIPNVYMKLADLFPTSSKFKIILCSAGNKKCLQALIQDTALRTFKVHQPHFG